MVFVGTGGTYMIEPVGRVLENRQLAIDNWAEVIWYSAASVARISPG